MSTDQLPPLNVAIKLPDAPYALASSGFLATLAQVETEVASMVVTDQQSAQAAANLQTLLTKAGSELEKARKALKEPFIQAGREIDQAAQGPQARIEAAKQKAKFLLTEYDNEQRRIAAEAEAARQKEIRRLQEVAQQEEAELRRKALEAALAAEAAAKASEVEVLDLGDDEPAPVPQKTETEKAIETLTHTPVVAAPKPVGITYRTTLVPTVTDVNRLPDAFVERTPKLRAIIATFCSGYKEGQPLPVVDGVKFEVKKEPVSLGRQSF